MNKMRIETLRPTISSLHQRGPQTGICPALDSIRTNAKVLINLEPSTQAGIRSHLGTAQKDPKRKAKRRFKALLEVLGTLEVKDITTEGLQSMVTNYRKQGASAKTVKNIVGTMRMVLKAANHVFSDHTSEHVFGTDALDGCPAINPRGLQPGRFRRFELLPQSFPAPPAMVARLAAVVRCPPLLDPRHG